MPGSRLIPFSISAAASGNNTILAALTGGDADKVRVIHSIEVVNTSATTLTVIYKNGATALNGAGYILAPGDQDVHDSTNPDNRLGGLFKPGMVIDKGNAFIINLDSANQLSGMGYYSVEAH